MHIFVLILMTIGTEILLLLESDFEIKPDSFVLSIILFFFLYSVLEFLFRLFTDGWAVPLVSIIPAIPLVFLFRTKEEWSYLIVAVVVSAILRLFLSYITWRDKLFVFGTIAMDVLVFFMWYSYNSFNGVTILNKLLLACLVAMTLSAIKQSFPFHYFLLMALLIFVLPVKEKPIDWSPVVTVIGKLGNATENAAYYLSDFYDRGSYTTGYGDLNSSGGKLKKSKKTQLSLYTAEAPYYVYTDDKTGKSMRMCRVLYLQGVDEIDKKQFIDFLQFLYNHNVDRGQSKVFSQVSKVDVEYVYLNTEDEIVPAGAIKLSGQQEGKHKKGYKLSTAYMDIDYGSPYLIELYRQPVENPKTLTFEEAKQYMKSVYRMDLNSIVSKKEYDSLVNRKPVSEKDLDMAGTTQQMKDLAKEITANAKNDYEKCKLIENYLRQYPYTTDAVGGHNEQSTMATTEGMADIADRFLFESKEGYCVHFTSSMVMLLRAAGVPAKAQSGYRYRYPFDKAESYPVAASYAHVWPLAYIEGAGWVPFEPTSGYYSKEEISWRRTGEEPAEDYSKEDLAAVPELEDDGASYDKKEISRLFVVAVVALIVLCIIVLIGLVIAVTALIRFLKYKYASNEQKLQIDVGNIKTMLIKQSDIQLMDRGLIRDYVAIAPEDMKDDIEKTFELYYRMTYGKPGENIISTDESLFVKDVRIRLKQ